MDVPTIIKAMEKDEVRSSTGNESEVNDGEVNELRQLDEKDVAGEKESSKRDTGSLLLALAEKDAGVENLPVFTLVGSELREKWVPVLSRDRRLFNREEGVNSWTIRPWMNAILAVYYPSPYVESSFQEYQALFSVSNIFYFFQILAQ